MNIADDLVRAFNDGYEKGKADAEFYLLHCGDTDEPETNADRIREMTEEDMAKGSVIIVRCPHLSDKVCEGFPSCYDCRLAWLKSPAEKDGAP